MQRSTIQLLRFHFSFFLLPVYLFALSQLEKINWSNACFVFVILHLLVYPASNGYNSYMDRDTTPIGGLQDPLLPTRQLFYITVVLDVMAVFFAFFISLYFTLGVLLYIFASRAYSFRGIRLKKFPVIGFLTVFIFQGALVFFLVHHACQPQQLLEVPLLSCLLSSLLIGSLYPLTQIYQHQEDKKDGVVTLSYFLGKRGTFLFSMILFLIAVFVLFLIFYKNDQLNFFFLYLLITLPVITFFIYWMAGVWRDEKNADFKNSFRMNLIATVCTSVYFITLIVLNH